MIVQLGDQEINYGTLTEVIREARRRFNTSEAQVKQLGEALCGAGLGAPAGFLNQWSASNTTGLTRGLAMGAHTANSFCSIPLLGVVDYRSTAGGTLVLKTTTLNSSCWVYPIAHTLAAPARSRSCLKGKGSV